MAALELHTEVLGWPDPETHLANLEVLRAVAGDYEQTCETRRMAATVAGLVRHLETLPESTEQALPTTQDAVRVLTYHKAKGLEWPVVVCSALNTLFGVDVHEPHIVAADVVDLADPLQGRSVRWWPWPYKAKSKGLVLGDRARETGVVAARQAADRAEQRRLLYVAFTRASDHLVLSRVDHKSGGTAWLDLLEDGEGKPILKLPWNMEGQGSVVVSGETVACTVATTSEVLLAAGRPQPGRPHWFASVAVPTERREQRMAPSAQRLPEASQGTVRVSETHDLGPAVPLRPKAGQMASVGDALHGFFAVDRGQDDRDRTALADRLRAHHGVEAVLSAAGMRTLSDRFCAWLDGHAPGAARLPEWPVRWLQDDGRAMSGDIDLLVPLEGGWLLLDHKSTTGDAAYREHKLRSEWSGQLSAYRSAVEAATGLPVLEIWIHLPVQGEVVQVEVPR
jgi:ATP-dependent exoDNAse (exonuclease V) beta subunit